MSLTTIGFFIWQIFRIVGSQIEIERIIFLANIFTNLKGCCLQLENLDKLIFDSKNWLNDARIGCKSPSDLVEFVDMDEQLEEEL